MTAAVCEFTPKQPEPIRTVTTYNEEQVHWAAAVSYTHLSTGRSYPGIRDKNQLGGIRYDYAITCTGACVVDRQGNVIAAHPLTSEEMYVLVDFCEDYNYPL